jgi:hypothetical protein
MKSLVKSIALGALLTVSTSTAAPATQFQLPALQPQLPLPVVQNFNCGPHLLTFVVKPLDQRQGVGIRCVKLSEGQPGQSRLPRLAWYGEGNWQGKTYRHVGHAFYQGADLLGSAADIVGNGENINNVFSENLQVAVTSGSWAMPHEIQVTGAWNEVWVRVGAVRYNSLPRPSTCGPNLDQYRVSDLSGRRAGRGLRCMLREGRKHTTWFGNGDWNGNVYSHVGTTSFNGYGAGDICSAPFGPVCNTFGWGSLRFSAVAPRGFDVTGAWHEKWR